MINLIISTFKAITRRILEHATPYGALSYQTPTSRNYKPFRTQLWGLLLAAHQIQTLNTYTTKPRFFLWTPITNFMLLNLKN